MPKYFQINALTVSFFSKTVFDQKKILVKSLYSLALINSIAAHDLFAWQINSSSVKMFVN